VTRVYLERRELPVDLIRFLDARAAAAECTPPLDVVETDRGIELLLDLPGVAAADLEIVFAQNVLLVTGTKLPPVCEDQEAGFHVAERAFGRFARAVSLDGAYDTARAMASLRDGELRVVLPRLDERRGVPIRIPVRG
jgi:HSP20 family protein